MKKEDLFEAMNDIDEQEIEAARRYVKSEEKAEEAEPTKGNTARTEDAERIGTAEQPAGSDRRKTGKAANPARRAVWTRWGTMAACLVVLIAAIALGRLQSAPGGSTPGGDPSEITSKEAGNQEDVTQPTAKEAESKPGDTTPKTADEGVKVVSAQIPAAVAEDMSVEEFIFSTEYEEWRQSYTSKLTSVAKAKKEMWPCYLSLMQEILADNKENSVCSPLNIYFALSMLAETTDGNTRQQILDLLAVPDVETLRTRVSDLMECSYANTPTLKCQLANSLWMCNGVEFNQETLDRLAKIYLASSFYGTPGSAEMDRALQEWVDSNTGGLLKEYTQGLHLDPTLVMALVSTLYYRAPWDTPFPEYATKDGVFHGTKGDVQAQMMHDTEELDVYRTEDFTALSLRLTDSGSMVFFLPREGVDAGALLQDPDLFNVLTHADAGRWSTCKVHLTVPKFDVSQKTDLLSVLQKLGITDALDAGRADFSPLTTDMPLYIGAAEHAARLKIEENGVEGAAYTILEAETAEEPQKLEEINFTLDRPFLFMVTGNGGTVLFAGVVRSAGE